MSDSKIARVVDDSDNSGPCFDVVVGSELINSLHSEVAARAIAESINAAVREREMAAHSDGYRLSKKHFEEAHEENRKAWEEVSRLKQENERLRAREKGLVESLEKAVHILCEETEVCWSADCHDPICVAARMKITPIREALASQKGA